MILCFSLSMPNVGSWNGKWGEAGRPHDKVINLGRSQKSDEKARSILAKGYYHYDFGDGWSAGISVHNVSAKEGATLRRKSAGFCGYDWMVESILLDGTITPPSVRKERQCQPKSTCPPST